jgi:hypothetical protein
MPTRGSANTCSKLDDPHTFEPDAQAGAFSIHPAVAHAVVPLAASLVAVQQRLQPTDACFAHWPSRRDYLSER